ncbi:hypothetical protein ABH935_004141 [Catenulispora sp. GAS73]|uniref:SAF domain-containing protein n=1 Tax=Catenulispora sp. GAS73 TaxID=3156269 RepID=UPI0035182C44
MPHVVTGLAMVLVAVVAIVGSFLHIGGRQSVLVVAAPVQVGQLVTDADLKVVEIAPGTGTSVVSADDEATVVGKPAAVPLAAGQILSPQLVGAAQFPPAGDAIAPLSLKSGALPAGLAVGGHVAVVNPASGNTAAQVLAQDATVTYVGPTDTQGLTVVNLLTDGATAKAISAVPEGLTLFEVPVGGVAG